MARLRFPVVEVTSNHCNTGRVALVAEAVVSPSRFGKIRSQTYSIWPRDGV
jgi:hypothetical protein